MNHVSDQIKVRIRRLPVGMSGRLGSVGEKEFSIAFLFELEPLLGVTVVPAEQEQAYLSASIAHKKELEKALSLAGQTFIEDVQDVLNHWTQKVASSIVTPPNPEGDPHVQSEPSSPG